MGDEIQAEIAQEAGYSEALNDFRKQKDEFFAQDPDSPIPASQRGTTFAGLRYFAPDLAYRVTAALVRSAQPQAVELGSTRGDIRRQLRIGEARFTLDGRECRLAAFTDADNSEQDELFIPFRDVTSGRESYGAGRYLEVPYKGEATVVLDFNLAYSPWCAYNAAYTCILPPAENTLPVAVRAGEQTYDDSHATS
jgi:uncharacterized protein (DUF1684 family)